MEYRVENKYIISERDIVLLKNRLSGILKNDINQNGETYVIRSLYFDTYCEKCIQENDAGIDDRKKYRMRIYNANDSFIRLEIKEKKNSLTKKTSCVISRSEGESLCDNRLYSENLSELDNRKVLNEFLLQRKCNGLLPKAIIEYERSAFVYGIGNVRITIDRNISVSREINSFFEARTGGLIPVMPKGMHILEVKYDEFIPDFILQILQMGILEKCTFSKYYLGCNMINGIF